MQRLGTALLFALTVLAATPVLGGDGVVLGIRPDGAVVDISALPGVQPGVRVGFVRPDAQRTPTGQGFVLDAQGGQALVGIIPGGGVQVNDLVVLCPAHDAGEGDQIRALVDGIRAQAPSPQVLATANRLQSVLDARNAALQQGNCDVARFDQEAQGLLAQLQSQAGAAQPASSAVAGYPAPASTPASGGYPPPAYPAGAATSGYPAPTPTYPAGAGTTGYPAPAPMDPAGAGTTGYPATTPMDPATATQPAYGAGATAPSGQPGDAVDAASRGADVLAKLALIAQSLGLAKGGNAQPGGPPMGGGGPPQGTGYPPAGGSPPSGGSYPYPGGSTPPAGDGNPASGGGVPPTSGGYPPAGGSASSGGYPSGGYPSSGGGAPTGGSPSGGYPPPGGAASGGTGGPAAGGTQGGAKPPWTLNQIPRAPLMAVARGTVMGRVQTQAGQPLAAVQVTVGDAKGQTDAQGQFSVAGLAPGQYTVTVSAVGYQRQTRTVTLDPGETEKLVVVMPRLMIPIRPMPKTP